MIYSSIFHKKVKLVHVPHRYWPEDPVRHGVKQLRVIGGVNKESLNSGIDFYKSLLDIPLYEVPSVEISEICKISENAYRYVQIAFAEELRMICEDLGLDFKKVREACNTKWNIEILDAREGIGGKCLPKDIHLLASLSKYNTLLRASKKVDKQYREWLKERMVKE
jgi:UDP-N-acetyl-D-mannosaminuronic acid dehydrogenase